MESPLVSICIPVYNGERYIRECIDSCLHQSFINYEIVVCDDNSGDRSVEIIKVYAKENPRVKLHKNENNLGLVGNWNRCIDLATGKWIKFVFQDDYITKDCLQEFVNHINPEAALMVSRRNFILPANINASDRNYYEREVRTLENTGKHSSGFYSPEIISGIAVQNMCMNFIGEPSLIFFKKDLVKELGYFNAALKQICDLEFALRIAGKYGLIYIPKKICAFRIHKQSTTNDNVKNNYFELRYIEPLLLSYFLLFDPHFEAFRQHLGYFNKLKLLLYFKVKAYQANKVNLKEDHSHYLFKQPSGIYKEINAHKNGGLLIKLIAALY